MKLSESAIKMRNMIEKAIEDHKITRAEYDSILHEASKDSHIDPHERALLDQLQQMIEDRSVRMVP